ncbi:MAG: ABC transporter permease [Gemmatimonadaceae bacterium]
MYVRIALRGFRRTPSFTITAILILAVGIGMAVAMFTVYDAVLVRNLPVREQDRIVELYTYRGDPKTDYWLLRKDLRKFAAESRTLRDVGGVVHWGAPGAPILDGDRPLVINRTTVTGNFFDVLGARPLLGRFFKPSDEIPGAEAEIVLSYGAWKRYFAGDSSIVGKQLMEPYARKRYTVIGIAPPGLDYPAGVGLWMPNWQPSDDLSVLAIARLNPGASVRSAQAEMFAVMKRLYPERKYEGVHAQTFTQAVVGDVRPVLLVLALAVGLLLLIACVNVGNLLLLRAGTRSRELSIRRALGASLGDIVRQLSVESAMLGVAGGVLGLVTAMVLIKLLVAVAPAKLPRLDDVGVTGAPLGIALAVTIVAVLLFGVLPAIAGSRGQLASPLRFDSRAGRTTRRSRQTRRTLVAVQVALALVMLFGAGLLVRTLERLQNITLGYQPAHLALLSVAFTPNEYNDAAGKFSQTKLNQLGERLIPLWRAVPGVSAVTPMLVPPFLGSGIFVGRMDKEGQTPEEMKANPNIPIEVGGADYFRAFGIPIRRGRGFTEMDREQAPLVAVVSESAARRFWPNEDPVGKRIHYWSQDTTAWRTIVGVAGDIHWRSLRETTPTIYLPWEQSYWQGQFAIRTSADLTTVLPAIRRVTRDMNPVLSVWEAKPVADLLSVPLAQPRLGALLLGAFAMVSMLLAAIGLYGVMSSVVGSSTRELGVRAALGATPERLRMGVISQALGMAGVGAVAGLVAALATARLLSSLLFEVTPFDPVSIGGAVLVLLVVAVVAAYIPAHRATRIDPVEALRAD